MLAELRLPESALLLCVCVCVCVRATCQLLSGSGQTAPSDDNGAAPGTTRGLVPTPKQLCTLQHAHNARPGYILAKDGPSSGGEVWAGPPMTTNHGET